MKIDAQTLLDALEGRIVASQIIDSLRRLPPSEILSLTHQANLSITDDGNIVGDNNVSIVVKGEGAAELASVLREALYRGRALFQLRPPVGDFVGRETEIKELMTALQAAAISGISGMGGIGKTELALSVADKLRAEYPDAQLFVNLRGTDPMPRSAADAVQSCLYALVGQGAKLPDKVDELMQLYRSQLNGKRALILLDNAADSAQVKPLLPPTGWTK